MRTISRRHFLLGCGAAGLVLLAEGALALGETDRIPASLKNRPARRRATRSVNLMDLKRSTFKAVLNSDFRLSPPEGSPLAVRLTKVENLRKTDNEDQFSLLFLGPAEPLLPQGTYPLAHDEIGEFALFLVPVWKDDKGVTYEAVFNRIAT